MPSLRFSSALILLLMPASLEAQEVVSLSSDITIESGVGLVSTDEDVSVDNQLGVVVLENLGALPANTDVIAFGADVNGDRLVSFDTTTSLPGEVVARPGDVVRYDGANYQIEFDAAMAGVPTGIATDALSLAPNGELLLSFNVTASLPGNVIAEDEDLVLWTGSGFSMLFDGSAQGVSRSLDVNGAQALGGGTFALSFDTAGTVGGIVFSDEDILRFDGSTWTLEYDASASNSAWIAADLDAIQVPEPGVDQALLAVGLLGLIFVLSRRREKHAVYRGSAVLLGLGAVAMIVPEPARAGDGILEINHVCATESGCVPGDAPGYPVTLTESGSYRLTSSLVIPESWTFRSGIFVSADNIQIDLNGFRIVGDGGTTAGIIEGSGIYSLGAKHVRVRNGFVQSMRRHCISLGDESWVEDVAVSGCAQDGIVVGDRSRVQFSQTADSGDDGIVVGDFSIVRGNIVSNPADNGVVIGSGSTAVSNGVAFADGFGLVILAPNHTATYGHNLFRQNNAGDLTPQVISASGSAAEFAPNYCGTNIACE